MLESNTDGARSSAEKAANAAAGTPAFKGFNRVGREDTTDTVLRQQVDPAMRQRTLLLAAIALLLVIAVGYIAVTRSHLSLNSDTEGSGSKFQPAPQQVD